MKYVIRNEIVVYDFNLYFCGIKQNFMRYKFDLYHDGELIESFNSINHLLVVLQYPERLSDKIKSFFKEIEPKTFTDESYKVKIVCETNKKRLRNYIPKKNPLFKKYK